jgi:modulator of FtsH protease HflK
LKKSRSNMLNRITRPLRSLITLNDNGWGRKSDSDDAAKGDRNTDPRNQEPRRNQNDGPPDLDKVWQDFNKKLGSVFGAKKGGNKNPWNQNQGGGGSGGGPQIPSFDGRGAGIGLGVVAGAALTLWMASGFYILPEGQAAAILRFGEFKKITAQAGISWRFPSPIESHEIVNVAELRQVEIGYRVNVKQKQPKESLMLTNDQSIVDLQFAAQYRISDPAKWLFENRPVGSDTEEILRQAGETAMRSVVGRKEIDQVLYSDKEDVAKQALKEMQTILERYKLGVTIIDLTIQQAQPPEQVQNAFEDANKAAQDRERFINEGRAYANDVIPKAKGTAGRLLLEAEGYKGRVIATAEGDSARFKGVLGEYVKAPAVTRERLYLDTMQTVFSNASKVFVDSRGNGGQGNLLYLPLDKLMQQAGAGTQTAPAGTVAQEPTPATRAPEVVVRPPEPRTEDTRARDVRARER